jgi:hypothetical protein
MSALAITVPLNDGETPTSFASRLAQANGRDRVRDFALDIGLDFSGIVAGQEYPLVQLASFGGCSLEALNRWAAISIEDQTLLHGEIFGWRTLRRSRLFACPACLMSDLANDDLDLEVRQWGRAVWQIESVRTCVAHGQALMEIAHVNDPGSLHDFAALAFTHMHNLEHLNATSARRSLSMLEMYAHARLEVGPRGNRFVDTMPLGAVMRLSQNIGAVTAFGSKVRIDDLAEDELHMAEAIGFEVISKGESGVRQALERLLRAFFEGNSAWGLRAIFGRLYEWLAYENDDPVYDQIRDIIERHVLETLPIGAGTKIFRKEVAVRRIHSLHSASIEYGLHPRRIRKILLERGVINASDVEKTDERILFSVEAAEEHLAPLVDTLSLVKATKYLNASRQHAQLLFNTGVIPAIVRGGKGALNKHAIRRADLNTFLSNLTASARPDVTGGSNIPYAARRANCSAIEIVNLLLDHRLTKVGMDHGARGFLSVLVDIDEVKSLVRGQEHGGLSLRDVERKMQWSTRVLSALIEQGLLPSTVAINPVNRCPQRIVTSADLDAFDRSFVSITTLSKELRIQNRKLKALLTAAGIDQDPAFEHVPATFYRRTKIQESALVA